MENIKMESVCAELTGIHNMLRAISVREDDVERMAAAKLRLLNASALCAAAGKELERLRACEQELAQLKAAADDDTEPAKEPAESGDEK